MKKEKSKKIKNKKLSSRSAAKGPTKRKRIIYRSAITGEIVTAKFAKEFPDTTVAETIAK